MFPFFFFFLLLSLLLPSPSLAIRANPTSTLNPETATITPKNDQIHHWQGFNKFVDAKKGGHLVGISQLKKYFNHFGYLKLEDMNITDVFDSQLEDALTRYQTKLGLSVTGKLNSETISEIMTPRCGVPDTPRRLHATRNYDFFIGQPRWGRSIPMTLTYAFAMQTMISPTPSIFEIKEAFKRAFSHWASVIPVTFLETDDYGFADIKIGFYRGDHGDGEPFDGVLGVLAHAFSPETGRFHLDAAETWSVNFDVEKSDVAIDLESVATHEIGHLLGLAHTNVKEAVMYPSLKARERKVDLKLDDIKGIQALYGSNPNFTYDGLSESDILSNNGVDSRRSSSSIHWISLLLTLLHVFVFNA